MRLTRLAGRIATLDTRCAQPAPKLADRFYTSPEYLAWRAIVIARAGGRCQDPACQRPGRRASRLFADHVVELKDGGAPLDPANGLARCGSCHTRKTIAARAARMKGMGV